MAWRLPVESGYDFPGFFSWKILPLRDFTWLPPGHDFTSLERDTRGGGPGRGGGIGHSPREAVMKKFVFITSPAGGYAENLLTPWCMGHERVAPPVTLPGILLYDTIFQEAWLADLLYTNCCLTMFILLQLFVYKWKGCFHCFVSHVCPFPCYVPGGCP